MARAPVITEEPTEDFNEPPRYRVMGEFFVDGFGLIKIGSTIEWSEAPNEFMVPVNKEAMIVSERWVGTLNELAKHAAKRKESSARKKAEEDGLDPGLIVVTPDVYHVPTMDDFAKKKNVRPTGSAIPKKRVFNVVTEDGAFDAMSGGGSMESASGHGRSFV